MHQESNDQHAGQQRRRHDVGRARQQRRPERNQPRRKCGERDGGQHQQRVAPLRAAHLFAPVQARPSPAAIVEYQPDGDRDDELKSGRCKRQRVVDLEQRGGKIRESRLLRIRHLRRPAMRQADERDARRESPPVQPAAQAAVEAVDGGERGERGDDQQRGIQHVGLDADVGEEERQRQDAQRAEESRKPRFQFVIERQQLRRVELLVDHVVEAQEHAARVPHDQRQHRRAHDQPQRPELAPIGVLDHQRQDFLALRGQHEERHADDEGEHAEKTSPHRAHEQDDGTQPDAHPSEETRFPVGTFVIHDHTSQTGQSATHPAIPAWRVRVLRASTIPESNAAIVPLAPSSATPAMLRWRSGARGWSRWPPS